jgi:LPXTG-motif cell wall-anchored protein
MAANDVVTPDSVVENTWGPDGSVTVSGTGTPGDSLVVSILDSNDLTVAQSYLTNAAVGEATVLEDGTYSITFSLSDDPTTSDFWKSPVLSDTVFAAVVNLTSDVEPIFLPISVTAFVPNAQTVTVDPICLSGDAARDPGVMIGATGFGQFEEGITYSVVDAAGTPVPGAEGQTLTADETGSLAPQPLTLYSTAGNIPDGQYTITFVGSVTTAGVFQVGPCDVPAAPAGVEPAAVVPAAPQLANTGSSDAGALVGGSALLLLVGAALVAARRRQNETA